MSNTISVDGVTYLRPKLCVADVTTVQNIPSDHSFDEVVTLGYKEVLGYDIPDVSTTGDRFTFRDGPHPYSDFKMAANFVLACSRKDKNIVVHCAEGQSRSVAVCSSVIAVLEDTSPEEVLKEVRSIHPRSRPDPRVWDSVLRYVGET
jgi:predicted protein tyrosine phosphatase